MKEVIKSKKTEIIRITQEKEIIEAFQQSQVLSVDQRR